MYIARGFDVLIICRAVFELSQVFLAYVTLFKIYCKSSYSVPFAFKLLGLWTRVSPAELCIIHRCTCS